ncbi:gliding motility-associated lipoprotein GldH [Tenacibaculum sp. MAR_2009_124]|uniref:gliding motility lipoprotein GldH n=1 Tax=Tenacibaculum sp. MAR_2009_124 TaxID=1250059 RepID=UPI00089D4BF4|nr:gliding motility lipoprotein GldH [Tenacibaculum sp. MAR_2009_124]SEC36578.1 gliding motility-associated lipoprotein GldH [Tenacibaculum sp. MAR_2009_124]
MLKTISKSKFIIGSLIAAVLFISCDKKRVFDEYLSLTDQKWSKNNELKFTFSVEDTLNQKNLFINIRNNKDYGYSNLFVITQIDFPDGNLVVDTLEYDMADATGKFLGEGFSDIKESKLYYKENILFPTKGNYTFKIRQAMRKNGEVSGIEYLEGVTDVGFRIEKTK